MPSFPNEYDLAMFKQEDGRLRSIAKNHTTIAPDLREGNTLRRKPGKVEFPIDYREHDSSAVKCRFLTGPNAFKDEEKIELESGSESTSQKRKSPGAARMGRPSQESIPELNFAAWYRRGRPTNRQRST